AVNPGDVLAAAGDRAAEAEPEGEQQLLEQAAAGVEDVPGAQDRQPHPGRLDLARRPLPLARDLGVEAVARRAGLVDGGLAAIAVVADRRLADQHPRPPLQGADRRRQVAGAEAAAVHDPPYGVRAPALVDPLAEQVDDAVDALEGGGGRPFEARLPAVPG